MSVQINYNKKKSLNNGANKIFFTDEKFKISSLKNYLTIREYSSISDLLKSKDLKKKILSFDISSKVTIILVSLQTNIKNSELVLLIANLDLDWKI